MKNWYNFNSYKPERGKPVVVQLSGYKTDIAYYCDGWYKLSYDPYLDILRKTYISEPITYWAEYDTKD